MATLQEPVSRPDGRVDWQTAQAQAAEARYERWQHWPVQWSGVWIGSLAALAAVLVFGLMGIALGAHLLTPEHRVTDLHKIAIGSLICSVASAFFAFVIGGWVAGKIGGILRSETGMVHGAVVWLVATPFLLFFASIGAGSFFGGWYGGLSGTPGWAHSGAAPYERPEALAANPTDAERAAYTTAMTDYRDKMRIWNEETPRATRNSALGAVTALLLGLVGSVIGGWMASGEPMTFTHYRTRNLSPARM